jgi:hypothetical protein
MIGLSLGLTTLRNSTAAPAAPYDGFLLLATTPDKLMLEGGTDAILLEGKE